MTQFVETERHLQYRRREAYEHVSLRLSFSPSPIKLLDLITDLQLGGGSRVISASSFCILKTIIRMIVMSLMNNKPCRCYLLADVPRALDIFGFGLASLFSGLLSASELPRPRPVPLEPAPDDILSTINKHTKDLR